MCTSLLDHTTPSSLGVIRVMCNDLPMFTLDSVLFTLGKYILGCTYHGNLFVGINKLPRLIIMLLNNVINFVSLYKLCIKHK